MLQYSEALSILRESAIRRSLGTEMVPIGEAVGRIASLAVASPEDVPSFNNSAMDGFAVRAEQLRHASRENPVRLKVDGTTLAGDTPAQTRDLNQARQIMTGAPMPPDILDSVIKIEDVEVVRSPGGEPLEIVIRRPVEFEANVRERGEDFRVGQPVLSDRTRILPEHIMALASVGVSRIQVLARPKVALISTGDELVHHETRELRPGMIRNSNSPYLEAAIPFFGANVKAYGTVRDSEESFHSLMERVLADSPDIVLTTGAVSMGTHDFIPSAVRSMGGRILYHKVAIRPGKPGLFAELPGSGPVFFGSPGNPVSTAVALRFFVGPYLRALAGLPPEIPGRAILEADTRKPEGLRCFFKAKLNASVHGARISVLAGQPSFMVSPLLEANAWLVLPEEGSNVPAGTEVEVHPLYPPLDGKEGVRA